MMEMGLEGKVAAVSAASRGIGLSIATALAQEGCSVGICARSGLDEAREKILSTGARVAVKKADITREADIDAFISHVEAELGDVDILVTNAGGPPPGPFESLGEEDWKKAVDLNLLSVARLCRRVLPGMKASGWGRIVNMTSVSVKEPVDNLLLSNVIRPGVVGLSKTLSREMGAHGITVNCVAPGYTATERLDDLAAALAERDGRGKESVMDDWTRSIPVSRLGEPEEIAYAVAFLCSERAGYISGATLQVDGGMVRSLL